MNLEYDFQWSSRTSIYGFYYKLEEDNTRATKVSEGGIMTICKGTKPLETGKKYMLEYSINYVNGDLDVGFGDERCENSCWLRCSYGYCITSKGIFILGTNVNSNLNLINAKNITFIVDLIKNKAEISIDEQKIYTFDINQDLIYYPMIAIRQLNNSVKLKITELNEE